MSQFTTCTGEVARLLSETPTLGGRVTVFAPVTRRRRSPDGASETAGVTGDVSFSCEEGESDALYEQRIVSKWHG
ncbi:MAG: hypothetical protein H6713_28070 [Myxococcales bacterium]|nr:hypothetical protein [Myxococcales bacterium]